MKLQTSGFLAQKVVSDMSYPSPCQGAGQGEAQNDSY